MTEPNHERAIENCDVFNAPRRMAPSVDRKLAFFAVTFPNRMLLRAVTVSEALLTLNSPGVQVERLPFPKQTPSVAVAITTVLGVSMLNGLTRVPVKLGNAPL